eukprot:751533-Hanusia_phi.AAC.3
MTLVQIVELETENLTLSYTKNHLKEEVSQHNSSSALTLTLRSKLQTVKAEKRNVESENSVLKVSPNNDWNFTDDPSGKGQICSVSFKRMQIRHDHRVAELLQTSLMHNI